MTTSNKKINFFDFEEILDKWKSSFQENDNDFVLVQSDFEKRCFVYPVGLAYLNQSSFPLSASSYSTLAVTNNCQKMLIYVTTNHRDFEPIHQTKFVTDVKHVCFDLKQNICVTTDEHVFVFEPRMNFNLLNVVDTSINCKNNGIVGNFGLCVNECNQLAVTKPYENKVVVFE